MKSLRKDKKIRNFRSNRVDVLLGNLVDKDVQSLLLPLNLMQNILFYPKYNIKDNFITPNSSLSISMSFCGTILYVILLFYRDVNLYFKANFQSNKDDTVAYVSFIFDFCFFCSGFLMNFVNIVRHTDDDTLLILKFQEVHRYFSNKTNLKGFIIGNWISVIFFLGIYIFVGVYVALSYKTYLLFFFISILMIYDANIIYAMRLIQLLKEKLDLCKIQALNLLTIEGNNRGVYYGNFFQIYVYILDCYDIYKTSFEQMIVYHAVELFCHALVHLQMTLDNLKESALSGNYSIFYAKILTLNIWLVKTLTIQIFLSIHCEKFYITMKNFQDSCAQILNSRCTDDEKKIYKNILRLSRARFDKMDACSMFYVDATLPVKMMSLLTNYIVVLLQFAIL